uniref:E3 ubiquitin-protein ligase RNF181 n=1 Tax=Haplochromis burtoni TaxID=8153 RepID=A0A3Q3BZP2_HAPBU
MTNVSLQDFRTYWAEMASYFDEHNCEPTDPEEQYRQNALLEMARYLIQGLDWIDARYAGMSSWDQRLPPPAAKTAVQTLTVIVITAEQAGRGLKCPVCLLEFEEQQTAREMPCKHLFHSGCILPWLDKTNSCPLCRLELPTDNADYEQFKKDKVGVFECVLTFNRTFIVALALYCCYLFIYFSDLQERRKQSEHRLEGLHGAMYT